MSLSVICIGKSGQLASELRDTIPDNVQLMCYGRKDINIFSKNNIHKIFHQNQPEFVINTSAYTAVDLAETHPDEAFLLNHQAVQNLAEVCNDLKIHFIHISTDFVFDGTADKPYKPQDTPNPVNVYGASKLAGENAILALNSPLQTIIRTSWLYSKYGHNFVKTMLKLMLEKDELQVVNDQWGCPTSANGLARFIWELLKISNWNKIYHWCDKVESEKGVSWYDFACEIQLCGLETGMLTKQIPIHPINSAEYPVAAIRPIYSILENDNYHLMKELPSFNKSLKSTISHLSLN